MSTRDSMDCPNCGRRHRQKLRQYNGIVADPETDVTVSAGATGSFIVLVALLNPGDGHPLQAYYQYHMRTVGG
jgi:aminotransferase